MKSSLNVIWNFKTNAMGWLKLNHSNGSFRICLFKVQSSLNFSSWELWYYSCYTSRIWTKRRNIFTCILGKIHMGKYFWVIFYLRITLSLTLTIVAQLVECHPMYQRPGQDKCPGCGFNPQSEHVQEATERCCSLTSVFLSL